MVRHKDVHAEPDAGLPAGPDLLADRVRTLVPGGEKAQSSGAVDGWTKPGVDVPPAMGAAMMRVPISAWGMAGSLGLISSLFR